MVSCSSGLSGQESQRSCSYLTPEFNDSFNALENRFGEKGFFTSWTSHGNPDAMTFVSLDKIYKKRILFSGEIKNIPSYWDAIGMHTQGRIPDDGVAFHESGSDQVVKESFGAKNKLQGVCKNFNSLGTSSSDWLLPTYSIMMILTGGHSTGYSPPGTVKVTDNCPVTNEYISNSWGLGLKPTNCGNKRFAAINIPGFIESSSEYPGLYTASIASVIDDPGYQGGNVWYFLARTTIYSGYVGMGAPKSSSSGPMRCASINWY